MRITYMTALRAIRGSVMVAIPKGIMESLNLIPDTLVRLSVCEGRLIVEPRHRPRFTLAQLIEQCDLSADLTEEDRVWLGTAPLCPEEA
jgi:antitoxin ChpS